MHACKNNERKSIKIKERRLLMLMRSCMRIQDMIIRINFINEWKGKFLDVTKKEKILSTIYLIHQLRGYFLCIFNTIVNV